MLMLVRLMRSFCIILVVLVIGGCGGGGGGGGGGGSSGSQPSVPLGGFLYVSSVFSDSVLGFSGANRLSGNVTPTTVISGSNTTLDVPSAVAIDTAQNYLYVANVGSTHTIAVFHNARTANGDIAPDRIISGGSLAGPKCLALDVANDRLFVLDAVNVKIYDNVSTLNGVTTPDRSITSLPAGTAGGCFYDATTDALFISMDGGGAGPDGLIFVYDSASTVNGTHAGTVSRTITGAATGLDVPRALYVDNADRLYVTEVEASQSVRVFEHASTAAGNVAPVRAISGASTGLNTPLGIFVNASTDELFVANSPASQVSVFANASTADGNVSPVRTVSGAATGFNFPVGIVVDPTRG